MSLNVAAEISVKLLESSNKEDMDLLYFLGCLPGGVTEEQLLKLWSNDVSESLERINALSFFEIGIERLQLTPTMINYIQDNIDHNSKIEIMEKICDFYTHLLQMCY